MARGSLVSQINIAPELEREARSGQTVQQLPSNGLSEAAGSVAAQFGAVGQKIGALADHAASVEGKREGHLAGLDPEFRTRQDGTIRGEAFDKAALDTYLAKTRVEIDNDIQAAAMKHQADPKGLATVLKGREQGWLQNAPSELIPEIKTLFNHGATVAQREATRQLWSRQAAEQQGALQAELQSSLRALHQGAFAAGLDPEADQIMASRIASLEGALKRTGPNGQRLVAPAQAATLLANAKEQVATARLSGAFERLPDIAAKEEFLKKLDADFAGSTGAAAAFDLPTFQTVRRHLEGELRRDQARERQGDAALKHLVGEVQKRADKGYGVDEGELATLKARVVSATPDVQAALSDAEDSLRYQQWARRLSLPELEVTVGEMRQKLAADPPSLGDRGRVNRRLEKAEALLKEAQAEIKQNPLGWEGRVGMTEVVPLGRVKMDDPVAVQAWGASRTVQAEDAARRHGLGRAQYLEPVEKRALAKQFEQGGQAGLAAVALVRNAFGDKAEAVMGELGTDAPAGALLGTLALQAGNSRGVLDAAEGLHLRTRDGYKRVAPDSSKAKIAADAVAGTSLGQATGYMTGAMKVADAIYETRAYRDGKIEAFDERMWQQAFSEALGEVDIGGRKYGGLVGINGFFSRHKVAIPPSVAQDKAAATFDAITPEDLGGAEGGGPRFANGRTVTRQELRGATYVTVAPGKYILATRNPTDANPGWLLDGAGKPFVVNIESVLPLVRRRRPDLR